MSLRWRDAASVQRSAGAVYMRDADSVQRTVDQIRVRGAGGYVEIYKQGLRLVASPSEAIGNSSAKTGPIYSNNVMVSVAGGTPPYTHSWTATSGIGVAAPTNPSTAFIATPPAIMGEINGTATDTVTDANGITNSITVDASIVRG